MSLASPPPECRKSALSFYQDVFISTGMPWNSTTNYTDDTSVCVRDGHCVTTPIKILMWWTDFVYLEFTQRACCQYAHLFFYISCPVFQQETCQSQTMCSRNNKVIKNACVQTGLCPLDLHRPKTYEWTSHPVLYTVFGGAGIYTAAFTVLYHLELIM